MPGIAEKEQFEQSSCFVFVDGDVMTFNGEILCRRASVCDLEGAVRAQPVMEILSKLPEQEVTVEVTDDKRGKCLLIKGDRRKAGIRWEADILLPIDGVVTPEVWRPLPEDFAEAVSKVAPCASSDEKSKFVLTCVHITGDFLEASDTYRIARHMVDMPVEGETLVRAATLQKLAGYDMTECGMTENWLYFRNPDGLSIACRRWMDEYRNMTDFLKAEGATRVTLPATIKDVVEKAEVFSQENAIANKVIINLADGRLVLEGNGSTGWYKEMKEVPYNGPKLRFMMSPQLLKDTSERALDCGVLQGRLVIDAGKFKYVSCTDEVTE